MNYQLAKNNASNLSKKQLIQKLVEKNLNGAHFTCEGNCLTGSGGGMF